MTRNQNIVIINYGMGNIGSVVNMLKYIGQSPIVSKEIEEIKKADKIILPGVGHFSKAMENLKKYNLIEVIKEKANDNKNPFLGICLGMQLLCNNSEEGNIDGLGLIDAKVKKFSFSKGLGLKIPHMGWNTTNVVQEKQGIFENIPKPHRFYFVHSYHVECNHSENVLAQTTYGYSFTSAFSKKNIYGVQFHPEKSHQFGISLFENFVRL